MASRLTAVALVALALAAPAAAQTPIIDRAAHAARGKSVYVHPGTKLLTAAEAGRLERQVGREARGPLSIAVLPSAARREADGTTMGVLIELSHRTFTTNPPAVYAVVVGNEFRAINRDISASDFATEAFRAHRQEGMAAVLSDFIRRVGEARAPADAPPVRSDDHGSRRLWILAVIGALAAFVAFRRVTR
jgi:hypothetical protein